MLFPGTGGHFPELKEWLSAQCSMLNLTLNLLLLSHVLPQLLLFANWTSCCYFGLVYNAAFSWPLTPVLLSALETINWATRKWRKLCNVDVKCMELRRCEQSLTSQPGRKLQNGKQGKQFDINKKGRLDIIYIYLHKIWNDNKEQSLNMDTYVCRRPLHASDYMILSWGLQWRLDLEQVFNQDLNSEFKVFMNHFNLS